MISLKVLPFDGNTAAIVNELEIACGVVRREPTSLSKPDKPNYRYIVQVFGKHQDRFGGMDHVIGYLCGLVAVLNAGGK